MNTIKRNKGWIRIAGNAANVRAGNRYGWRCFLKVPLAKKWSKEIALVQWSLKGEATERNVIPGTYAGNDMRQVVAWIDLYGDVEIKDDVLQVTLRNPAL